MNIPHQPRLSQHTPVGGLFIPSTDPSRMLVSSRRLQNINTILEPSQNLGGLFLGDVISTLKQQLLKNNNIRAVLSCMSESVSIKVPLACHKILMIKDILEYPIIQHFDDAVAWIDSKRKEKYNVLVHCHAGVSRSATIVIAYLIRTHNMNPIESLNFIRKKRERAKPNASFWNQINQYYNYWSKNRKNQLTKSVINVPETSKQNVVKRQAPIKLSLQQHMLRPSIIQLHNKNDSVVQKEAKNQQKDKIDSKSPQLKRQKSSITQRKRIFDRFQRNGDQNHVNSQYQIKPVYYQKQSINGLNSILNHSICNNNNFIQNKSAIQPNIYHNNDIHKLKGPTKVYQSYHNNLPVRYSFILPQQSNHQYLSPFQVRSYIRSP